MQITQTKLCKRKVDGKNLQSLKRKFSLCTHVYKNLNHIVNHRKLTLRSDIEILGL